MPKTNNPFGSNGWTPEMLKSQTGKTFVISGANAGAGFEATRLLVSRGASVVMLCRNPEKAATAIENIKQEYPDAKLALIQMDLGSLKSVKNAAEAVMTKVPKIDALICNAAIAQVAKQELTSDGFESQLGVNHYGHFLLCGLLFSRIEESKGRVVVVGSLGYKMGSKKIQFEDMNWDQNYSPMNTYGASKLAQMVFAYELQRRVKSAGKPVQVHVCHPGAARTELGANESNWITRVLFFVLAPFAQSAERGAWPEVLCATEAGLKEATFYGPTGRGDMVGPVGETDLQPHALDRDTANRLWGLSEKETGLSWNL